MFRYATLSFQCQSGVSTLHDDERTRCCHGSARNDGWKSTRPFCSPRAGLCCWWSCWCCWCGGSGGGAGTLRSRCCHGSSKNDDRKKRDASAVSSLWFLHTNRKRENKDEHGELFAPHARALQPNAPLALELRIPTATSTASTSTASTATIPLSLLVRSMLLLLVVVDTFVLVWYAAAALSAAISIAARSPLRLRAELRGQLAAKTRLLRCQPHVRRDQRERVGASNEAAHTWWWRRRWGRHSLVLHDPCFSRFSTALVLNKPSLQYSSVITRICSCVRLILAFRCP